jgi:hypothetical protein
VVELRRATVLIRPNDFIVQPTLCTTMGLYVSGEPITVITRAAPPSRVGEAVRGALEVSMAVIPHPTDWRAFSAPLLTAAGVRSWNAIQRSARHCRVEATGAVIRIIPSRNGGTAGEDKGYHPLVDQAIVLPADCTDEQLGIAVEDGATNCR